MPAFSLLPTASTLAQPPVMAALMVFAPTPKQAQTVGPGSIPSRRLPSSRQRRSAGSRLSCANRDASQLLPGRSWRAPPSDRLRVARPPAMPRGNCLLHHRRIRSSRPAPFRATRSSATAASGRAAPLPANSRRCTRSPGECAHHKASGCVARCRDSRKPCHSTATASIRAGVCLNSGSPECGSTTGFTAAPARDCRANCSLQWIGEKDHPGRHIAAGARARQCRAPACHHPQQITRRDTCGGQILQVHIGIGLRLVGIERRGPGSPGHGVPLVTDAARIEDQRILRRRRMARPARCHGA